MYYHLLAPHVHMSCDHVMYACCHHYYVITAKSRWMGIPLPLALRALCSVHGIMWYMSRWCVLR